MQTLGIHSDSLSNIIQVEQDLAEKQEKLEKLNKRTLEKRSMLKKFEKYLHPAFFGKSPVCKHQFGCFENCIRKAFKTFIYGFGFLILIKTLSLLSKPSKLIGAL